MFKKIFTEILDFVIPPLCVSCNNPLENSDRSICSICYSKLVLFKSEHPWLKSYISKGYFDNSFSLYQFVKDTPVQYLIHSLKYEKMKSIGLQLGADIARKMPSKIKFDYAVPVPLHSSKYRERTYNQSEYICSGIASAAGAKVIPQLLFRNRSTKSQTNLNKAERLENVSGAFGINKKYINQIHGRNIILADDVITTGATIVECAKILKENGAGYIMICSAAYDTIDLN